MWKRYHFSVEVCEKGIAIPLGGTSLYKTSLSTPVHFWGWNRLIRAKNQLSSIKPTYIQVCWFPGSGFVSTSSSSKYAAKLSISSIYSSNSIFLVCVRRVLFLLFLLCAQTVVWPFLWKTREFFHLSHQNRLSRSASLFMAKSCFIVAILLKLAWRFEPIRKVEICWMNNN